jgi:hypothetical protein
MEDLPQKQEGEAAAPQEQPTPAPEQSAQVSAPQPEPAFAILESAGIAVPENATKEWATDKIRNLNSLVGDQTTAKQRKVVDKLLKETGLSSLDELVQVIETEPEQTAQVASQVATPERIVQVKDESIKDEIRSLKADQLIAKVPEAAPVLDRILNRARELGTTDVMKVWNNEYEPIMKLGLKKGEQKLRSTVEQQPVSGASNVGETEQRLDFKTMTAEEMRAHLPIARD